MKRLNLIPLRDERRNCFDDAIVSILNWHNKPYNIHFIYSWFFKFQKQNQEIPCILQDDILFNKYHYGDAIKAAYNITVKQYPKPDQELVNRIINELDHDRPLLADVDAYWLPWFERDYHTNHHLHATMIIGYDLEKGQLCCADTIPYNTGSMIDLDEFTKACNTLITFEPHEDTKQDYKALLKDVVAYLKDSSGTNTFEEIRKFAKYLEDVEDLQTLVTGKEDQLWTEPLFFTFNLIGQSRRNFAFALQDMAEKSQDSKCMEIANQMDECGIKWQSIKGMIVKAYYMNSLQVLKKATQKIYLIADKEEAICDQLEKALQDTKTSLSLEGHSEDPVEDVKHDEKYSVYRVDLKAHFNNKAFSDGVVNTNHANFTGNGAYYEYDDQIGHLETLDFKNIPYEISQIGKATFDNVICKGQTIKVPNQAYKKIAILGAGEWGNHMDTMALYNQDELVEEITIKFSDWFFESVFEEEVVWSGKGIETIDNRLVETMGDVRLFCKTYKLKTDQAFTEIKLPNYPNIHIFAITLIK